jgi:hypothetical protein
MVHTMNEVAPFTRIPPCRAHLFEELNRRGVGVDPLGQKEWPEAKKWIEQAS